MYQTDASGLNNIIKIMRIINIQSRCHYVHKHKTDMTHPSNMTRWNQQIINLDKLILQKMCACGTATADQSLDSVKPENVLLSTVRVGHSSYVKML